MLPARLPRGGACLLERGRRSHASLRNVRLPLLRLPTVVFPSLAFSLRVEDEAEEDSSLMTVPRALTQYAWEHTGGRVAAMGPGARVGVELSFVYDDVLGAEVQTPPGVCHALGGSRVRLVRMLGDEPSQEGAAVGENTPPLAILDRIHDLVLSPQRSEKLEAEAEVALALASRGRESGRFALEPCTQDDELGGLLCDPRAHPLWHGGAALEPPDDASALGHYLAARLPLTTALRARLLALTCPLQRLQSAVDAMRLLLEPDRLRRGHRMRIIVSAPAGDNCSISGAHGQAPRYVVGDALPQAAWQTIVHN